MTDKKHRGMDAKINHCMWAFAGYAARCKPVIAVFESVRPAFSNGRDLMQRLRAKLEEETGLSYTLYHVMHNAYELGGVAIRPRYFWVASQVPFGVEHMRVRQPVLRDAIGDIENAPLTWNYQPHRYPPSWWSHRARNGSPGFDGHAVRPGLATTRALDLLKLVNENFDHGWPPNWHIGKMAQYTYEKIGKLPASWEHMREKLIRINFHMGFTSLTRWDMDRAGRVITGGALNLVMHPTQNRTITHREAARVMGFPDDWKIAPIKHYSGLPLTWGKGITVQCGKWIGHQVINALDGYPGSDSGIEIGDREFLINAPKTNLVKKLTRKDFDKKNLDIMYKSPQMGQSISTNIVNRWEYKMTEPTEPVEGEAQASASKGRGRPRPDNTVQRDQQVLDLLNADPGTPKSREDLAAALSAQTGTEVKPGHVYLSLYRLRKDGKVSARRENGKHVWTVAEPQPVG